MKDSDIATRDRLLAAAIREFADKGFEGATVRDICERANVNVNGVKYYFEDKNGLYIAAVAEAHRVSTRMDLHALPDPALPAEQRLRQFVSGMVAMMMGAREEGDPHHTLMLREMANPTEATEELVRGTIEPRFRVLDSLLSELLPPGTSPLQRQLFGFSIVGQCMHYKVAWPIVRLLLAAGDCQQLTQELVACHIADVILSAIAHRCAASSSREK